MSSFHCSRGRLSLLFCDAAELARSWAATSSRQFWKMCWPALNSGCSGREKEACGRDWALELALLCWRASLTSLLYLSPVVVLHGLVSVWLGYGHQEWFIAHNSWVHVLMRSWISACLDWSFCVKSSANWRFSAFSFSLNLVCQATQPEKCLANECQHPVLCARFCRQTGLTCWPEMGGLRRGH